MTLTLGIDLGTTNSCVAAWRNGEGEVMVAPDGGRTVPSVVAFTAKGERLVGAAARRQMITNPAATVASVKRFMGRRFSELTAEELTSSLLVQEGPEDSIRIEVGERHYAPEQISAMILEHLIDAAESFFGERATQAVITVPAYFNDAQRQATKDAGQIAGLDVKRIINEPTAAALAYGLDTTGEETILVFDLGGGTFDVSVLEIADGVFEVRATAGDNRLGGDDFDTLIATWLREQVLTAHPDATIDAQVTERLREAAERAKRELTGMIETDIALPFLTVSPSGPVHLECTLTRSALEGLCAPLLSRLDAPVQQAIADAQLQPGDIDRIILVGGMTRMPAVAQRVQDLVGVEPQRGVNPDEVVAMGAAIQAEVLTGDMRDVLLLDVTPLSLGLETRGGVVSVLIARNATIPVRRTEMFTTGEDGQPSVEINIYQGERALAVDNRFLGRLELRGIQAAPRGVPQIEVTFALDADGILEVAARDLASQAHTEATIEGGGRMNEDVLAGMLAEAERMRQVDAEARRSTELRNQADALLYAAEQALPVVGDALDVADRRTLVDAMADVREALNARAPVSELSARIGALMRASAPLMSNSDDA